MRNPVASKELERAERAAASLRRSLGIVGQEPLWLAGLCGAIDGCGRPYVHVSLSQWRAGGGNRFSTAPDGEVPALPKWVDGLPVFVAVSGCFGEPCPGRAGVPCVPVADQEPGLGALGQGSAAPADVDDDPMNSPVAAALSLAAGSGLIIGAAALVFRLQGWSTKLDRRSAAQEENAPWIKRQQREERQGPGIW